MRYKIVSEQSTEKLEEVVGLLLKVGWQPQGGIAFHDYDFYQVLTHPEDEMTPLELEQLDSEIGERLADLNPIFAIPDQDLTEEQKTQRQNVLDGLIEAARRAKSEKDLD